MKFEEHENFELTVPIRDSGIPAGAIGVVLLVLSDSPPVYEVEFCDDDGFNLGQSLTYTLEECKMKPVKKEL
jgi:hypothetical protein